MKQGLGKVAATTLVAGFGLFAGTQAEAATYTIQYGDSFYSIAQSFGVDPVQLASSNGMTIFDLIVPGQQISVPGQVQQTQTLASQATPAASGTTYRVQAGDSFYAIAAAHGVDATELAAANGLTLDSLIVEGQSLTIPGVSAPQATAEAAPVQDSYKIPGMEYEPGVNYPVGQCTWAAQKVSGWAGDWWGNAADWARNAANDGFTVGQTPAVGSIAVWTQGAGGYGHVAYVTDVAADGRIQVLEANYAGIQTIGNHRGWFNPAKTTEGAAVYIYPR